MKMKGSGEMLKITLFFFFVILSAPRAWSFFVLRNSYNDVSVSDRSQNGFAEESKSCWIKSYKTIR